MARVNITIPDQLVKHAKAAELNISRLASIALSDELNRRSRHAALGAYLARLDAESGPIGAEEAAKAKIWADRVLGPRSAEDDDS